MLRPFLDLLGLVHPEEDMRVVDLGCGSGALTLRLHETLRATSTLGVDRSLAMLDESISLSGKGVTFEAGDIATFAPEGRTYSVVFSSGALDRLRNHERVLASWTRAVDPNGQLAVQLPARSDAVWHRCAEEIAEQAPFADVLGRSASPDTETLAPLEYATILAKLGYREQSVRLQVHGHWLPGPEAVVDWAAETLLTRYRMLLGPLYGAFLDTYRRRVLAQLGDTRPFFFPSEYILLWGRK